MKSIFVPVLLGLIVQTTGNIAMAAESGHHESHAGASTDMRLTEGIVKKIDRAAGKVTLAHGPLPNGMAAMTMAFKVRDASRLAGLKENQKVLFAIDDEMIVVRIEAAK